MEAHITESVKELLTYCFNTDDELLDKNHIEAPNSLEKCVDRTYRDMMACNEITVYRLSEDNETAGYFGIENYEGQYLLTGFMLNKKYRDESYKQEFWRLVNNSLKGLTNEYYCGIYQKNERASNFLGKSGGTDYLRIRDGKGNKVIFYKFKLN